MYFMCSVISGPTERTRGLLNCLAVARCQIWDFKVANCHLMSAWGKADINQTGRFVRFCPKANMRAKYRPLGNGHRLVQCTCLLLTQSGHWIAHLSVLASPTVPIGKAGSVSV